LYSYEVESLLKGKKINIGDRIKITKGKATYEGLLMPRIELGDTSSIVIKLKNGYNVGIKYEKEVKTTRIEKGKPPGKFPTRKIKPNSKLPTVSMLSVGGTIVARVDYVTGGVTWVMSPEEIFFTVPDLENVVNVRKAERILSIASENLTPKHWIKIAEVIAKELNSNIQGIVVMHGTDTMHYSTAALSFMLRDLNKPVVFTGAQRSTDRGSSDNVFNLICSSYVAGHSDIAEVGLCMHGEMNDTFALFHRGTKVRKMHTSRRDTYRSINDLPIAKISYNGKIEITNQNYRRRNEGKVKLDAKFEEKVAIIKAYPGATTDLLSSLVNSGYKGIVIEATGLGHVPTGDINWIPDIKAAIDKGIAIVLAPQTLYGRLDPYVYEPARKLFQTGVIYAQDMLPEVAYVKLGWVLGHTTNPEKVREMMLTNIAGEITERSDTRGFLE
jgi:glutamyl-tRNA(Gln) amidotransferase subunit D